MNSQIILATSLAAGVGLVSVAASQAHAAGGGTWTVINDPGEARELATVTLLQDGRVLVAGGEGYQGVLTLVELFDPKTNIYATAPRLSVPRDQATATLLPDGDVLVVGGTSDNVQAAPLASAEIYHPSSNTWTPTGSLAQPRFGHQATLLQDGRVLVMGGTPDVQTQLTSCEIWNPKTGQWTKTGSMVAGRRYSNAATLPDGNVLEAGDGVRSEVYSIKSRTWSFTGAEPAYIFSAGLVLLQNGGVLAPPSDTANNFGSGETYDPTSNTWKRTRPSLGRYYAATTLLQDGSVLIAGGCTANCSNQSVNSAVRYIPSQRAYVNATSMNVGRESAAAITLKDGRVLMQGGFAPMGAAGAEIFTP